MGTVNYKPRTIEDEVTRDGLCGVSKLEENFNSSGLWFVVGGIATQSYLPSSCRRPTSDIDLAVLRPLNYSEFKDFGKTCAEFLNDNGYSTQLIKGHNSYMIRYSKGEKEGAGIIEFARRNSDNFSKIAKRLLREKENTRKKVVEGKNETYEVSSPEDIVSPKLVRSIKSLMRNPEFMEYAHKTFPLKEEDIKFGLNEIDNLRDEATVNIGDPRLSERLRFASDLFDIRILSEVIGFNENYLSESIMSWNSIKEYSKEKDLLLSNLLPKLSSKFFSWV